MKQRAFVKNDQSGEQWNMHLAAMGLLCVRYRGLLGDGN